MPVKLSTELSGVIPVTKLKDGQVAVITQWIWETCAGRIVQRYGKHLITIGLP